MWKKPGLIKIVFRPICSVANNQAMLDNPKENSRATDLNQPVAKLLLVAWAGAVAGVPLQPTTLLVSSTHKLNVPAFSSYDHPKCDQDENIYYRPVLMRTAYSTSVLMRLEISTETPTLYQPPSELAGQAAFMEFAVTPSGRVWFLDQMKDGTYTIYGFNDSGDMDSQIPLKLPKDFSADRFEVAEDGVSLVGGFFTEEAGKDLSGRQFLTIVDKNGRARKTIDTSRFTRLDLSSLGLAAAGNPVVSGPDGNFYYLEEGKILVISEWGDLVREMSFQPPEDSTAANMELSDGLLSIEFDKKLPGDDNRLQPRFLVLQSATGAPFAFYAPPEEIGTSDLCFTRTSGYLFQKIEDGKLTLLSAALR